MGISTGHDNPSSTPTDKISLADKLAAIKQQKETNQKNAEDESLTPIRNQIKDLQKNAFQIDLVIGAIEEHTQQSNDEKVVKDNGIKNYAKNIEQQFKDESSKIQTLTNKNKSLLTEMGIETTEQLIDNPEFTTTEEVIAYKKAKTDAKELVEIDDKNLQEKLKELGVEIDPNNFSYDLTVKALKEKKEIVKEDILIEKSKTPEGRDEVIEILSSRIENDLPKLTSFTKEEIRRADLLPKNLALLENKFGSEIVKSVIMKVYEKKASDFIAKREKKTIESDQELKSILESINPQKKEEARRLIEEFGRLSKHVQMMFEIKGSELRKNGIHTIDTKHYLSNFSGNFENVFTLARSKSFINTNMDRNEYPPKIDFNVLIKYVNSRIESIDKLHDTIQNLKTKEDVYNFMIDEEGIISAADPSHYEESHDLQRELKGSLQSPQAKNLLEKFQSYQEAFDSINQNESLRNNQKEKLMSLIDIKIDLEQKTRELDKEKEAQHFSGDVGEAARRSIEDNRIAVEVMGQLVELEGMIGQEDIIVENGNIKVLSYEQDKKTIDNALKSKQDEQDNISNQISEKKSNEPRFIKGKWQKELDELEEKREKLTEQIQNIEETRNKIFEKIIKIRFPKTDNYDRSGISNLYKEQNGSGKPDEVFKNLKEKLEEMANKTIPASLIKLDQEYKALEKKFEEFPEK